jgi:hypothetical protein
MESGKRGNLTGRERLVGEIIAALEHIDEEGLVFLLEQANVLLHNARVEELDLKRRRKGPAGDGTIQPETQRGPAVAVEESPDRKAFFLTLGTARKVLSLEEMRQVVRICHAAESEKEAARRLYAVLQRERRDILMDGGIEGAGSPLLGALVATLKARYRPKEA